MSSSPRRRTYRYPHGFKGNAIYPLCCTGAVVPGDEVIFRKIKWHPDYEPHVKPLCTPHHNAGVQVLSGKVIHETKGGEIQNIFTVRLSNGEVIKVTSVTMYRGGTYRKVWADEALREAIVFEKYEDRRAVRHGATKLLIKDRHVIKEQNAAAGQAHHS